jgi:hypothetical protein
MIRSAAFNSRSLGLRFNSAPSALRDAETQISRASSSVSDLISRFNHVTVQYPNISLYSFLCMRSGTWYLLMGMYSQFLSLGPELAIGYLAAKVSGKFRQPLNISLAAILANQFPVLGKVKASALLGVVQNPQPRTEAEKKLIAVMDWVRGPVDKYGFAMFLASKMNIALTILGTGVAIRYGIDIATVLSSWGVSDTLQNGAGAMAMATLTNVVLLPGHLYALTHVAPAIVSLKDVTKR